MKKTEQEQAILDSILKEFKDARDREGKFASHHEAYALLKEEVEELWEKIKGSYPYRMINSEAKQVAAMALGIMLEFNDVREDP